MTGPLVDFGVFVTTMGACVLFSFWWWRQAIRGDLLGTDDREELEQLHEEIVQDQARRICHRLGLDPDGPLPPSDRVTEQEVRWAVRRALRPVMRQRVLERRAGCTTPEWECMAPDCPCHRRGKR